MTSLQSGGSATLVLASSSSYRRELLERLGLPFSIVAPEIEEAPLDGEIPAATSVRLAETKARAVADRYPRALIIGCDQVAACDGLALGKARDRDDALALIEKIAGPDSAGLRAAGSFDDPAASAS